MTYRTIVRYSLYSLAAVSGLLMILYVGYACILDAVQWLPMEESLAQFEAYGWVGMSYGALSVISMALTTLIKEN